MRYTLIELVQSILDSMDSDEVNTIADTTESLAVAKIVRENYFNIIGELEPKEVHGLFHLDASTDNTQPCVMYLPSSVIEIEELKYNVGSSLSDVDLRPLKYLCLSDFMTHVGGLSDEESWVQIQEVTIDGENFFFKYRNDEWPTYWTSPDDKILIFDSYKSGTESTLTSSRSYGIGHKIPVFQMIDTFVPDLDPQHFQLLLSSSKAQAFVELKQTQNPNAERKERRNRLLAFKTKDSTDPRKEIRRHRGYGRTR